MLNVANLEKLKQYLLNLNLTELEVSEVLSAYQSIIPVLADISKRMYIQKGSND